MGGFRIKSRSCRHVQSSQKWFKNGLNWFKFKASQPRKPLSRRTLLVQALHGGEKEDIATTSIHEDDMKVVPIMHASRNDEIREQFGE